MSDERNNFKVLRSDGESAQVRCPQCGNVFTTNAAGEDGLVYCYKQKCLVPECPRCGTTEAEEPEGPPRILLLRSGETARFGRVPYVNADHCILDGGCPTPKCACKPFKVQGHGRRASKDEQAWEATARCVACQKDVGTLRYETGTFFGVREDEAVLSGPWKVY